MNDTGENYRRLPGVLIVKQRHADIQDSEGPVNDPSDLIGSGLPVWTMCFKCNLDVNEANCAFKATPTPLSERLMILEQ
jgi:hypothetical protein